jgi:hypothetical protein
VGTRPCWCGYKNIMSSRRRGTDRKTQAGKRQSVTRSDDARAFSAGRVDRRCGHCLQTKPHYPRPDGAKSTRCVECNDHKRQTGKFPPRTKVAPWTPDTWVFVMVEGERRLGYLVRKAGRKSKVRPRQWLVSVMNGPQVWVFPDDLEFAAYPEESPPT